MLLSIRRSSMAVHLKMDFRVVELAGTLSVLQCDRGDAECLFEVEFHKHQSGSLVSAIRQMRNHHCEQNLKRPVTSHPESRVLSYPKAYQG
jgi:hypothetical protein